MNRPALGSLLAVALLAQSVPLPGVESREEHLDESQCGLPACRLPTIDREGTVRIPNLAVPLSTHMSEEARRRFTQVFARASEGVREHLATKVQNVSRDQRSTTDSGCAGKEQLAEWVQPLVDRAKAIYPVDVEERRIAGVRTEVIAPRGGVPPRNDHRVLINLHGGGYSCFTAGGLLGEAEAIPIAGAGQFKVVAIDYRTSPDYTFPAANEDVAAVYRELLKNYKPENIGLYGCSTGATLSAGSLAWFQKEGLPRPGAVGLIGDGATKDDHVDGVGWFINAPLALGQVLAPDQSYQVLYPEPYMKGTDYNDPLVAPVVSRDVLSKFPPTLVISGTRDVGLSEAVYTHTQLVKVGVEAELHIWEGQWHCSFMDVEIPESREVYDVTTKFFERHLGK